MYSKSFRFLSFSQLGKDQASARILRRIKIENLKVPPLPRSFPLLVLLRMNTLPEICDFSNFFQVFAVTDSMLAHRVPPEPLFLFAQIGKKNQRKETHVEVCSLVQREKDFKIFLIRALSQLLRWPGWSPLHSYVNLLRFQNNGSHFSNVPRNLSSWTKSQNVVQENRVALDVLCKIQSFWSLNKK